MRACALDATVRRKSGLDAAPLARPAAIVRDRRDVADRGDVEARRLNGPQRRFAARTRTRNLDLERPHAVLGAFLAQSSAAICAAKGVDLREPLNPMVPAEDHEIVLPCASVMVIIVLLNVEFTWATPDTMFLRSRRRTRVASFAIIQFLQSRPSSQALGTIIDSWRRLLGRSLGGERHEQLS